MTELSGPKGAAALAEAMQRAGLLERPAPPAAERWIETFIEAYSAKIETAEAALDVARALRAGALLSD